MKIGILLVSVGILIIEKIPIYIDNYPAVYWIIFLYCNFSHGQSETHASIKPLNITTQNNSKFTSLTFNVFLATRQLSGMTKNYHFKRNRALPFEMMINYLYKCQPRSRVWKDVKASLFTDRATT